MPSSEYAAYVKVVKNFSQLTLGTDYTVSGATVTLSAGITATDSLFLVYPPAAAVRVEADYCKIDGTADRWSVIGVSYAAQSNVDTGSHLGFFWKGRTGNLTMINSTTVLGIQATKGSLRLSGAGASDRAEINRSGFVNIPTSAAGLSGGTVWSDGGTLKIN